MIISWLSSSFSDLSVPANSVSTTKSFNLPISSDQSLTHIIYTATSNAAGTFCSTYQSTSTTVTVKLNNFTSSAKTVNRINLISIYY